MVSGPWGGNLGPMSSDLPLPIVQNAEAAYTKNTEQASTITRSLAIACIGIVWLFGTSGRSDPQAIAKALVTVPCLALALVLAVVALFLDLLHYTWASLGWGAFSKVLERIWHSLDDPTPCKAQWRGAAFFKIDVAVLECALKDDEPELKRVLAESKEQRRIRAHDLLGRAIGQSQEVGAKRIRDRLLRQPRAPRIVRIGSFTLFCLKVAALTLSYLFLLLFMVPLVM